MYLVTAKVAAYDEDFPGSRVEWKVGQTREVHDSLVDRFRNNPAAWTVSGGNDSSPLSVSKTLTGMVDFSGMLMGALVSGQWFSQPSIFRLLLNGTGTVTLDSKDAGGVITTGVFSAMLTNAVNQIEFPYAGDGAIQIRASLTGTATAQVI